MEKVIFTELSKEELNELIEVHERLAHSLGFTSLTHFEEWKYHVVSGLIQFGGTFHVKLGECLNVADIHHSIKLLRLFYADADKYAIMHKIYEAKRKAGAIDE